ncbi:hypothetical protein QBC39DRAFT_58129 [Podospora conica]|nr:hypothetical protein QBC39DRAFT_58129 [Schizothecium conicum]
MCLFPEHWILLLMSRACRCFSAARQDLGTCFFKPSRAGLPRLSQRPGADFVDHWPTAGVSFSRAPLIGRAGKEAISNENATRRVQNRGYPSCLCGGFTPRDRITTQCHPARRPLPLPLLISPEPPRRASAHHHHTPR